MKVSGNKGTSDPIPAGVHNGVCIWIAGIGQQPSPWGPKTQIILTFEMMDLHGEFDGETKPRVHSQYFNATLGGGEKPSRLRELLEGWRGCPFSEKEEGGFELSKLLGVPAMLVFQLKKDGVHTEIKAASKYSGEKYDPFNPLINYDPDNHDPDQFALLPEWIQGKVNHPSVPENPEPSEPANYDEANAALSQAAADQKEDDIPF